MLNLGLFGHILGEFIQPFNSGCCNALCAYQLSNVGILDPMFTDGSFGLMHLMNGLTHLVEPHVLPEIINRILKRGECALKNVSLVGRTCTDSCGSVISSS